jgi:spore coat polysaccharide biosynthesis protein SpsF
MILAIIQARLNSQRLPGKVLLPILGKPMLLHMVERVKRSKLIDKLIIATSWEKSDEPIIEMCKKNNIEFWRGPLGDVLTRFYGAAKHYKAEYIVRLTGDCPLVCAGEIDNIVTDISMHGYDYLNNANYINISHTPDGLDIEAIHFDVIENAWKNAKGDEREHLTKYIWKNSKNYFVMRLPIQYPEFYNYKLSVDTPEDFARVSKIFEALYPANPDFGLKEIIEYLEAHHGKI